MADESRTIRFTVPVEPAAPTVVRHRIRALDHLADGMRPDFELLLSEVVANVVRHSGLGRDDVMEIAVRIEPGRVRAEVTDAGRGLDPAPPAPSAPAQDASSGYGLYLVDRIAARWGTSGPSTTIWFELEEAHGTA